MGMHSRIMKGGGRGVQIQIHLIIIVKLPKLGLDPPPPRPAQHNHLLYPPSPEEKIDPQGADPMTSHNRTI